LLIVKLNLPTDDMFGLKFVTIFSEPPKHTVRKKLKNEE